jgi:TRAP-type C4-dicarboxylate transport system permease small subunit
LSSDFLAPNPGKTAQGQLRPSPTSTPAESERLDILPFGANEVGQDVELVQGLSRHLKWRALDPLERVLMVLCGVCLAGFSCSTLLDVVARVIGHPLLWPQEVTSTFFIYGVFVGAAVATRRNDHLYLSVVAEAMTGKVRLFLEIFNRLVVLLVGLCLVIFGWQNFLTGFGSFRMPSMLPIAYLYWPIPVCGALVALFSAEQIVNGIRNGFGSIAKGTPQGGAG